MLHAVLRGLKAAESIVATLAYAIVAGLLMIDVIGRELFNTAFLGMQQLAVYGAIVAGFLGLTLATSDNAHLRPAFLDVLTDGPRQAAFQRAGDALSAAFFLAAAAIAWSFVAYSMESGDKAPVFYFLLWPLQLIIPYAFISAAVKHAIFALRPGLKPTNDGMAG